MKHLTNFSSLRIYLTTGIARTQHFVAAGPSTRDFQNDHLRDVVCSHGWCGGYGHMRHRGRVHVHTELRLRSRIESVRAGLIQGRVLHAVRGASDVRRGSSFRGGVLVQDSQRCCWRLHTQRESSVCVHQFESPASTPRPTNLHVPSLPRPRCKVRQPQESSVCQCRC